MRCGNATTGLRYYVPTGDGNYRPAELMEWATWFEQDNAEVPFREGGRRVGDDMPRPGVRVSTVFLGTNMAFGGGVLVFETMVFGGPHDDFQRRYSTLAEAEAGHAEAVRMVAADE